MLWKKVRNVWRAFLQARGSSRSKRQLWNGEFAGGRWDYIDHTPEDFVYQFLEKYAKGGSILDLGCGSGNTGNELKQESYHDYTGVDISDVAIERAKVRSLERGREEKNHYLQSDLDAFRPDGYYDVILFRESLFYVPLSKIKSLLDRQAAHLTADGVFIVRMYDRVKYRKIVELIERNFDVVEAASPAHAATILMVFRPHSDDK